jgi:hypothetical protein
MIWDCILRIFSQLQIGLQLSFLRIASRVVTDVLVASKVATEIFSIPTQVTIDFFFQLQVALQLMLFLVASGVVTENFFKLQVRLQPSFFSCKCGCNWYFFHL